MAGEHDFDSWSVRVAYAWTAPPINAFRVTPLAFDGSGNAVALLADADGTLHVTGAGGSGGDGAILDGVSSSIKATVKDYTNSNPLAVQIMDNNGDPASIGGGTQYDDGAVDPTITGNAVMWKDLSDVVRVASVAKPLPVSVQSLPAVTVSGFLPTINGLVTVTGFLPSIAVSSHPVVTVTGFLPTINALATITGFLPSITGTVTANAGLGTYQVAGNVTANAGLGTFGVAGNVTANAGLGTFTVAGIVTANAGLGTFNVAGNVTANAGLGTFTVTGNVTASVAIMPATEAVYATFVASGVNLTHTSTWTTALSAPSNPWRQLEVMNTTDVDIDVSFDASTIHRTYPAGGSATLDYYSDGLKESSAVSIRNDGTVPTRGKVYVNGIAT